MISGPAVGRGVDVPEGVKVVLTTSGVSDVLGGLVVRYGVVLDIGMLGVEDTIVGTLGVVDQIIGVSDTDSGSGEEKLVGSVGIVVGVVGI